jgi:uncharacterized membrane protein YjjP (DUF1212 family)
MPEPPPKPVTAATPSVPDSAQMEDVAHLALQVGRLLMLNGADTEQAQNAVLRFAAAFGCEANLLVTYEALLVTLVAGDHFRTKIGHRLPGMNVGMRAVQAVGDVVEDAATARLSPAEAGRRLDAIEHAPPAYPRWLVMAALGVTSASLSRLFGGDWGAFVVAGVAGALATWPRLELGARRANPVLAAFAVALLGGVIGGIGVRLGATASPALCLVAPCMVLVPGVPLINGVRDLIRNHVTLGLSRLGFAGLVVSAIALGLFAATALTGVRIPVAGQTLVIGAAQDAVFSALAAAGFALLFGVPARMAWACAICGVASHTLRVGLFDFGVDLISGTLLGALAAGLLAMAFARRFHAPAVAFAFPGVVPLVPGAYAFRAFIGGLEIAHGATDPSLVADTFSLVLTATLMVAGIAVGIAAPALLFPAAPVTRGSR